MGIKKLMADIRRNIIRTVKMMNSVNVLYTTFAKYGVLEFRTAVLKYVSFVMRGLQEVTAASV